MVKAITYGTFDLFHEGHYRLLQKAEELGNYLIMGVTTEKSDMEREAEYSRSVIRIENVKKTGLVDEIIIEESQE